jgi:hypothetical protein
MAFSINTPVQRYIDSLSKVNSNLSQELIKIPEFNQQLEANINKDSDFEGIEKYIKDAKSEEYFSESEKDKVLIVDYENVAFATYNWNKEYKLNIEKYRNFPINISNYEVIRYRSATYFILNYAFKRKYKHVFIVCKTPTSGGYFKQDYNDIKSTGELFIKEDNVTFKCDEIKDWLSEPTPKCTLFQINNDPTLIRKLNSNSLKKFNSLRLDVHALQGSDDSIVLVLYKILKSLKIKNIFIMSEDTHMVSDFKTNQKYIIPFELNITNFKDMPITLSINYKKYFNVDFNDDTINRIPFTAELDYFYYGKKPTSDGNKYIFKSWYKVDDDKKLQIVINSDQPGSEKYKLNYIIYNNQTYCYDARLRENGNPYLDSSGEIVKLDNHKDKSYAHWDIQKQKYVPTLESMSPYMDDDTVTIKTIKVNDEIKPYCYKDDNTDKWVPTLNENIPYYNEGVSIATIKTIDGDIPYCYLEGKIWYATLLEVPFKNISKEEKLQGDPNFDTISPYVWQPYLKKYDVTKSNNFYNKYLKYKVKYTSLKNKLNV